MPEYQDRFGNKWKEAHFNGHEREGYALSFWMFLTGAPIEDIRAQQKREEPIGGWSAKPTIQYA